SAQRSQQSHNQIGAQVSGSGRRKAMMEYKGYIGKVEIDEEAGILHGEVINIRDVVTFEGQTVDELQQAFRDSVEDYLAFCAQRGEAPEKPFSGKFVIRLPTELHRRAYVKAKLADKSLNSWVTEVLETAVQEQG
ncbi:MAG: type II toxin-antitoxin system HicB family antitoxin, partial [Anaerolineales bacterium]|nr:type II toxin-antitoxin system HicB family antitoxin [Anaerolineales bacterium]